MINMIIKIVLIFLATFLYSYKKADDFIGTFYQSDKGTPYSVDEPCSILNLEKDNIFICKNESNKTIITGTWWYYSIGIEGIMIMKKNDCFEILTPLSTTLITENIKPRNCINALHGFHYYRLKDNK